MCVRAYERAGPEIWRFINACNSNNNNAYTHIGITVLFGLLYITASYNFFSGIHLDIYVKNHVCIDTIATLYCIHENNCLIQCVLI